MNVPPFGPTSTNILIPEEPSMQISAVYPSNASQVVSAGGNSYLQLSPEAVAVSNCLYCPAGMSLLYQSSLSDYYAFLTIAAIASVALVFSVTARQLKAALRRAWDVVPSKLRPLGGGLIRRRGPKTLLTVFMGVCVVIMALSAVFSPPPQPRAYLATPLSSNVIGQLHQSGRLELPYRRTGR